MSAYKYHVAGILISLHLLGCGKEAQQHLAKCKEAHAKGDQESAKTFCQQAIDADILGKTHPEAKAILREIQQKEEKERAAEKEKVEQARKVEEAKAEKARLKSLPKRLHEKIEKQAMWDLGRGTATPVKEIFIQEMGKPLASYDVSFGLMEHHVWGALPVRSDPEGITDKDLKATPFSITHPRKLTCGDYTPNMIEWYSYGERLWPKGNLHSDLSEGPRV